MCVKNNITGSIVENTFQNRKKTIADRDGTSKYVC